MTADFFPPSPVATDAHLGADELPFTAFGQFGADTIDMRVFQQDVYWVNTHGQPYYLTEMDLGYLRNVKNFLYRGADDYHMRVRLNTDSDLFMELLAGAPASFEEAGTALMQQSPEQWLAGTVLMQRIESLITEHTTRD